ncbi:MAG: hypothetical protein RR843_07055, partial [Clostridia bacterium]
IVRSAASATRVIILDSGANVNRVMEINLNYLLFQGIKALFPSKARHIARKSGDGGRGRRR